MEELKIDELKSIDGGSVALDIGTLAILSIGIPFVFGLFDGFIRPLSCN